MLKDIDMPKPPVPTTYTCPSCGWSKTVAPRSDALMPGDFFDACPACGRAPLETKDANAAQAAMGQLADSIKRLWR